MLVWGHYHLANLINFDVLVRTTVAVLVRPDLSDPLDSSAKPKQDAPIVGFHDVAPPLGPEQFDYDDSGGEYHIAVELGLRC